MGRGDHPADEGIRAWTDAACRLGHARGGVCGQREGRKGRRRRADLRQGVCRVRKLLTIAPGRCRNLQQLRTRARRRTRRLDDAKVKLAKAVELDPPGAGKYHYNLGALLMNSNQTDGALDEFKKAIDGRSELCGGLLLLGSTLVGKATLDQKTGKMVAPHGTIEALQKYLQLKPDGPNAQSAKDLIAALGSSVNVDYKDPNAPAPKSNKKGK